MFLEQTIEFCVCATHLCHLSENARLEQLEQLLTEVLRLALYHYA